VWNNHTALLGVRPFLQDPPHLNSGGERIYDIERIRKQISQLLRANAFENANGPLLVDSIIYNDPRTWVNDFDESGDIAWDGDGVSGKVRMHQRDDGSYTPTNGVFTSILSHRYETQTSRRIREMRLSMG
jgi:hypothetical protein